ncbi:MAG: O-antigen ligase family protein, partial [Candidatus Eremiobacterota bacterium]
MSEPGPGIAAGYSEALQSGTLMAARVLVAGLIFFPCIPALIWLLWWTMSGGSGEPSSWLLLQLLNVDSGAQTPVAAGALRFLVLLAGMLWLLRPLSLRGPLRAFCLLALVFLVTALASGLLSSHPHDALLNWMDLLCFFLAAVMTASFAGQGFSPPVLAGALGLAACLTLPTAYVRFWADAGQDYGAMVGTFYQPNMFAAYLELGLGACLALYFGEPEKRTGLREVLAGLASVCILAAIYRSYSQGAWLVAWGIAHLVLALLPGGRAGWRLGSTLGVMLLLLALVSLGSRGLPVLQLALLLQLAWLAFLIGQSPSPGRTAVKLLLLVALAAGVALSTTPLKPKVDVRERAVTAIQGDDPNIRARLVFWRSAWRMFREHPWLGVGLQGYQRYSPRYQPDVRQFSKFAHCLILTLLCETGLVGTMAYLLAGAVLLGEAFRR